MGRRMMDLGLNKEMNMLPRKAPGMYGGLLGGQRE
jgi:hypothetical protein